jgi:hypothetical protein
MTPSVLDGYEYQLTVAAAVSRPMTSETLPSAGYPTFASSTLDKELPGGRHDQAGKRL